MNRHYFRSFLYWNTMRSMLIGAISAVCSMILMPIAQAANLGRVFADVARDSAKVADHIPVRKADELIADLAKSRAAREAVDAELKQAAKLSGRGGKQVLRGAARSEEVLRLLRSATSKLDPDVIRSLEKLDAPSREAALVLRRGGQEFSKTLPDLVARGRLLREGGAETVAAAGKFGPDAARAALRVDQGIRGGSIMVKQGTRAVTVADFGQAMSRYGDASWQFWKKYVVPHWGKWAASGALAAYLANPEAFQNATGELTEAGFKHLTEFGGEVAAAAIRGTGEGTKQAAEKVVLATRDTFLDSQTGIFAIGGTVGLLLAASLILRRVRYWFFWPLRWLNRVPAGSVSRRGRKSRR